MAPHLPPTSVFLWSPINLSNTLCFLVLCSLKLFPPRCYNWVPSMLFSFFYCVFFVLSFQVPQPALSTRILFFVLFLVCFVAWFSFSSVDHHFRPFGWFFNLFLLVFLCFCFFVFFICFVFLFCFFCVVWLVCFFLFLVLLGNRLPAC